MYAIRSYYAGKRGRLPHLERVTMWQLNQSLDGGQGAAVPAPSATGLQDRFARRFGYLRLSLTEVCNFRCSYCLPEGYRPADGKRPGFLVITSYSIHYTKLYE